MSDERYKDETWLREQYARRGRTMPDIADRCGVTAPSVKYWLDKHGIPVERDCGPPTGDADPIHRDPEWLRERYWSDGMSLSEVADAGGVSIATVATWMERHDVPRRSAGARPVPRDELLEDVENVVREFGRPPTREEYERLGAHSSSTVAAEFGTWTNAKLLAGRRVRFGTVDAGRT